MVFFALVFAIILVTLMINSIPVLAFNKHGPTPIPGNLFPHPGIHNGQISKSINGTLHSFPVTPSK